MIKCLYYLTLCCIIVTESIHFMGTQSCMPLPKFTQFHVYVQHDPLFSCEPFFPCTYDMMAVIIAFLIINLNITVPKAKASYSF